MLLLVYIRNLRGDLYQYQHQKSDATEHHTAHVIQVTVVCGIAKDNKNKECKGNNPFRSTVTKHTNINVCPRISTD